MELLFIENMYYKIYTVVTSPFNDICFQKYFKPK